MPRARASIVALLLLAGMSAVPARAAFHLMKIREVFPGTTADPSAQYVELQMFATGQNLVGGHRVRLFDAAGTEVAAHAFTGSLPNGSNQTSILVATAQAQALFGVTPDLVMMPAIAVAGGAVCFDSIDCVTWGSYLPTVAPDGTRRPLNPTEGLIASSSATRDISAGNPDLLENADDTNASADDWDFLAPTPRNNAGNSGVLPGCVATFASSSVSAGESDPSVAITVDGCGGISVQYSTVNGTASAGTDYVATSGTLTFGAATQRSFEIPLLNDGVYEGPGETFGVRLRAPQGAFLTQPDAMVTIVEASPPPAPPSSPRNLVATGGIGQISLAWDAPTDDGGSPVTGYAVFAGHASASESRIATIGNVLTFTEAELDPGVTRFYLVRAINAAGEGAPSNGATATTDPAPPVPGAPQSVVATGGLRAISVTWAEPTTDGGSAVLGYRVYEGVSSASLGLVAELSPDARSLTRSGLGNGATRFYRVLAYNANGAGTPSPVTSATTFNIPSAVRSLTASAGNGQISLQWLAPSSNGGTPVTGYRIYRGTTQGQETPLATVGTTLAFVDAGLPHGAFRSYRVSAINAAGEGSLSNAATATTFAPPSAPLQVNASPGSAVGEIQVAWQPPAATGGTPVTDYIVYRISQGAPEVEAGRTGGALIFTDRGLSVGTRYFYRVSAVNLVGEGPVSTSACNRPYPWLNTIGCTI